MRSTAWARCAHGHLALTRQYVPDVLPELASVSQPGQNSRPWRANPDMYMSTRTHTINAGTCRSATTRGSHRQRHVRPGVQGKEEAPKKGNMDMPGPACGSRSKTALAFHGPRVRNPTQRASRGGQPVATAAATPAAGCISKEACARDWRGRGFPSYVVITNAPDSFSPI